MGLAVTQVTSLSASVPNLRELFLCGNQISTLECDVDAPPAFPRLQVMPQHIPLIAHGALSRPRLSIFSPGHRVWLALFTNSLSSRAGTGLDGQRAGRLGRSQAPQQPAVPDQPEHQRQPAAGPHSAAGYRHAIAART